MKYLRVGIYLLVILFFILPFVAVPRFLKVGQIECYNQYGLCSDEFLTEIKTLSGNTFYKVKEEIKKRFGESNLIENYSFRFKFPASLRIDLVLKKAKYALIQKDSLVTAVVDSKGFVLEKEDKTNLPGIYFLGNTPEIGTQVDENLHFGLELIYGIYYLYQIKTGEVVNDSLEVYIPNTGKIILPLEGDVSQLLGSMKLILSRLNSDENLLKIGKVKEIDLRYKNPVLRYE